MSYLVKISEVEELGAGIKNYESQIEEASESLKSAIEIFLVSDSFEGQTADSMKAYMEEVHIPLIDNVYGLVAQLSSDYAACYMSEYESGITAGDKYGEYSESAFEGAKGKLESLEESYVPDIDSYLNRAMDCIGGICPVSRPSTSKLKTSISNEIHVVWDLKGRVADVEGKGVSAFSSMDSTFGNLLQSIVAAMEMCNSNQCCVWSYTSGTFSQIATVTGLRDNYLAAMSNQSENAQLVHDTYEQAYSNIQLRIDDAEREAADKKIFWAAIGTAAQVASVVVGAFALVALFPVTSVLGLIAVSGAAAGLASGIKNLKGRESQLEKMQGGDYGADFTKSSAGDITKAGKVAGNYDKIEKGLATGDVDSIVDGEAGLRSFVIKEIRSGVTDCVKGWIDDDGADAALDVTGNIVDEGIDMTVDYVMKGKVSITPTGVVGLAADCTLVVADRQVEKYDQQIEDLNNQREDVARLQEENDKPRTYATSVDW